MTLSKLLPRALVLGFMLLAPLAASTGKAADPKNPAVVEAFVDGAVKPVMESKRSYAGVVAWMMNGELVFAKGYGYSDLDKRVPVDPATSLFRPGSISKLFTWVAVMQQVEAGVLDLDVDINSYLRSFQIKDSWPQRPVTLRHIMTHTAGFESGGFGYLMDESLEDVLPLVESLERFQPERVNPPGEVVSYSNWATALAGLIVAEVTGVDFNTYIQRNIFAVLGMANSSFAEPLPAPLNENMTKAYNFANGDYVERGYEYISNFGPAGGSAVTATDMVIFARAILGGGAYQGRRILKQETLAHMLEQGFSHDPRINGMGLGFIKRNFGAEDLAIYGHDGGTSIFVSHFGLSDAHNSMLFTSFAGPGGAFVHQALIGAFYAEFFPPQDEQLRPAADFNQRAARYTGSYFVSRNNHSRWESVLKPLSASTVAASPDGALLIDGKKYVEVEENLFRELYGQARIAFLEDGSGAVNGYVLDGMQVMQYYRVPAYLTLPVMGVFLALAVLGFIGVLLKTAYQWTAFKSGDGSYQRVWRAALAVAVANLAFLLLTIASFAGVSMGELMHALPGLFKFALVFPLLAVFACLFHVYRVGQLWCANEGVSLGLRIRSTWLMLLGCYMVWFYATWHLLGWNYFE